MSQINHQNRTSRHARATRHRMLAAGLLFAVALPTHAASADNIQSEMAKLLDDRCESCHNDYVYSGNWSLADVSISDVAQGKNAARWEAVLKAVSMGDMPPAEKKPLKPEQKTTLLSWLETSLDTYAEQNPNPGRATLRRLNRSEYANSVRDLLSIDIDITHSLPGDDSGYGFDNNADVLGMSTTLLERYLSVAGKVARLASGVSGEAASKASYVIPKDGSVKNSGVPSFDLRMNDNLPLDSRGGGAFDFYAPRAGTYEIAGFLNANTNNEVDRMDIHRHGIHVELPAGKHNIGMAFRKQLSLNEYIPTIREGTDFVVLPERAPELVTLDFILNGKRISSKRVPSYHMSSRFSQAAFLRDVMEIEVIGPYSSESNISVDEPQTPSLERIFICSPKGLGSSELGCAEKIVGNLISKAYRRPVNTDDIEPLINIFKGVRTNLTFESSIATVIQAILVSPHFLYLQETTPAEVTSNGIYAINDYEFAARLALFLWSSLPDQELMAQAKMNTLRKPEVLQQQIKRMLASPKAHALTQNFAGQWLYLRNLPLHFPDVFEFPDFNVPLRQSMQRETELFFSRILQDNTSIFDFLNADYSYLNERLAKHYGIEGVKGNSFRKVSLEDYPNRGGVLGHASVLTLTSNPNHTSPVKRGKWILDNILAASPPPPPPDVPALIAEHAGVALTAREQLARHREDPVCAACHVRMDPLGLSLERFNAVGAYRTQYAGQPIDVSAQMPNGSKFNGLAGLHAILWDRRERFANAFIDRLLTYALGRGLEAYDQPTVRRIANNSSVDGYKIHDIIEEIVTSTPFNFRKVTNNHEDRAITHVTP